jgi:hypothetical protein
MFPDCTQAKNHLTSMDKIVGFKYVIAPKSHIFSAYV